MPSAAHAQQKRTNPAASDKTALVFPTPPRIEFRARVLENGLAVYAVEDHSLPRVAVQVWYKAGGKDDPDGRGGIAHIVQHLMFGKTRNLPSGGFDRIADEMGGETNARTDYDNTVFETNAPAPGLERVLWAEAERMAQFAPDAEDMQVARQNVRGQWADGVADAPYGRLDLLIGQYSYERRYNRPVIGAPEEVDRVVLAEARAFHQKHYRPDNTVLVVVGDFAQADLDAMVDRQFGGITGRAEGQSAARLREREPAREKERRFRDVRRGVPLPALAVTYLLPGIADLDLPTWEVLQASLSEGEGSRLVRTLVNSRRVAASAFAYADLHQDAGLFVLRVTGSIGGRLDATERTLLSEMERLQTQPLAPVELERARSGALSLILRDRETQMGKATALGLAAVLLGDAGRVNSDPLRIAKVTAEDVQRVARRTFGAKNRVVIQYLTEGSAAAALAANSVTRVPAAPPSSPAARQTALPQVMPTPTRPVTTATTVRPKPTSKSRRITTRDRRKTRRRSPVRRRRPASSARRPAAAVIRRPATAARRPVSPAARPATRPPTAKRPTARKGAR